MENINKREGILKKILKDFLIELNGLVLFLFFSITKRLYKIQSFLLKDQYPKNYNIQFEIDDVIIQEKSKSNYMSGPLNNYTAQHMTFEENHRYKNYTVSLNIPFKNQEKAMECYSYLRERFKNDESMKRFVD